MNFDLAVVGGGPAGMGAAITASSAGAKVAVIDENSVLGGKLLGQLHEESNGWWIGKEVAEKLVNKAEKSKITVYENREVWGIYPDWRVMLNSGEALQAKYVLIATGAAEKAIPVPGWTLPGVMAIGAAQVLTNYHRVIPGKKVAIIGLDPLALTVSRELTMAGVKVAGIFLPPHSAFHHANSTPESAIAYLSSLAHLAPSRFLRMAGKLAGYESVRQLAARFYPSFGIRAWKSPLLLKRTVVEIMGENQVSGIKTMTVNNEGKPVAGSEKEYDVDCVCISGGLYPLTESANAAGCKSVYIEDLGGHVPLHSPQMETTKPGIFVAGNITGIESAKVAMKQGELAGVVISERLGLLDDAENRIRIAQDEVEKTREESSLSFQPNINGGRKKLEQLWKNWLTVQGKGEMRNERNS
ncbi:NAD(P)/FAD-dependent oxidoreductase [Virgibacillus kekensis]|uniref:NAD(P)/FAD-dependent oxidoreductase n=1 Tax=Virgibacillus kekensis TaxID=202261 RepID=A0ABV9DNT3_9BACI